MKNVLLIFTAMAALAAVSSAEINFSDGCRVVKSPGVRGFSLYIAQDPVKGNIWTSYGVIDTSQQFFISVSGTSVTSFIKSGDHWIGTSSAGLTHVLASGAVKIYTKADGLPSNNILDIAIDTANSLVIVGTDAGLCIITLDASGNAASLKNYLLGDILQRVLFFGKMIVALDRDVVFIALDGYSWKTFDASNSTIGAECYSAAIDKNGNVYISTSLLNTENFKVGSSFAKFNFSSKTWSTIDMSSVDDSLSHVTQVMIDRNDQLWCVFPFPGWLVKMDLATGVIEKSATDGTGQIAWLNGGADPVLGSTVDNDIIIGGNGVIVFGSSNSAVLPRIAPKMIQFQLVNQKINRYDLLGRAVAINTFSNQHNSASGISISAVRTPAGYQTVKGLLVK